MTKIRKLWNVTVRSRRYSESDTYHVVAPNFLEAGRKALSRAKRDKIVLQPFIAGVALVGEVLS